MARKSKKPRPGVPGSTPAYSPFVQSPSPVISRAPAPTPATPALPIPALPAPLVPPAKPAPAAPSPQPVNLDFLIAGFGLKALNDNGMINYPDAPANDIGPAWPTGEVHPVFARKNWLGLGDADWAHLQTALKLATCFLYDPAIITYFTSLLNLTPLPDPGNKQKNKLKQDLFSFGHDRTIHDADTIMAFKRMAEMRDRVTWEFTTHQPGANRSLPKNAWGITYPCHAGYGAMYVTHNPAPTTFTQPLTTSQHPPPQNLVLRNPPRQPLPDRPTRHNQRLKRTTSKKRTLALRPNLRPPPHALPPRHPPPPRIHPRLPPRHLPKEPQHKIPRQQPSSQTRKRLRTLLPRPPYRRTGMCVRRSSFRRVD